MNLQLPENAVSDRVSFQRRLEAHEKYICADLESPGCIRHIKIVYERPRRLPMANRKVIIRIYFDDESIPYVESPLGDFFGVMHGEPFYPINTHFLSIKTENGYNCYFPMPFAKSARLEFEAGDEGGTVYLEVDWHRYPGQAIQEPRRFCARWRREMPTQRYGDEFLMLDADGPGQLIGFVYGVRLIDDVDRWSHGGADNIYIDGEGVCLRHRPI